MAVEAFLVVLVFLVAIGGSLLLYLFVREERNWQGMDREAAEDAVRRDREDR